MGFHPLMTRRINHFATNRIAEQLDVAEINRVDAIVHGLHAALRQQVAPVYTRPEHPVEGWGLTATPLMEHGSIAGIPTINIIGRRAIYLASNGDIARVLTAPHPRQAFADYVVDVSRSTIPALLYEDPTLYSGIMNAVDEWIGQPELDYTY